MATISGYSLSQGNAILQTAEVVLKVATATLWAGAAYRMNYSAYAKRDQSAANVLRTACYATAKKRYAEALLLALLLALVTTSGFYTTVVSSIAGTSVVGVRSVDLRVPDSVVFSILQGDVGFDAYDKLLEGYATGSKFSQHKPAVTPMERIELAYGGGWTCPERGRYDGPKCNFDSTEALTSTCQDVEQLAEAELAGIIHSSCWWYKPVGDQTMEPDMLMPRYDGAGALDSYIEAVEVLRYAMRAGVDVKVDYRTVLEVIDGANRTLLSSSAEVLVYSERGTPAWSTDKHKGLSEMQVNTLNTETTLTSELGSFTEISRRTYYGEDANGRYTRGMMFRHNVISVGELVGMNGTIKRLASKTSANILVPANGANRLPSTTDRLAYRPSTLAFWDTEALRKIYFAHTNKVVSGSVKEAGYTHGTLVYSILPVIALATLAWLSYIGRSAFEVNSVTENMYVNNNDRLNDCASEGRSSRGALEWVLPERWARERIWVGSHDRHVSVVVGGALLRTLNPPGRLGEVDRWLNTRDMLASRDFWSAWNNQTVTVSSTRAGLQRRELIQSLEKARQRLEAYD